MAKTFIKYEDQYWLYGGDKLVKEKGLIIGGYESAGLTNLVAAWILEMIEELFDNSTFNGIYCNNGINITNEVLTLEEIKDWVDEFQSKVNR